MPSRDVLGDLLILKQHKIPLKRRDLTSIQSHLHHNERSAACGRSGDLSRKVPKVSFLTSGI
jgi:hypothetical protein